MRQMLPRLRRYLTEHEYARVRLKVRIADPRPRGRYDHQRGPLPEVDLPEQSSSLEISWG